MLLYYHKDPLGNFGDDLNPWLWRRIFPSIFTGEVFHDPALRQTMPHGKTLFVGIGTLLNSNVPTSAKKIVFGSGTGYGSAPQLDRSWEIAFVRGPLTAKKLGLDASKAIIDPAILAIDHFPRADHKDKRAAYMPHCSSARQADWKAICDAADLRYIDPHWPVEKVLAALQEAPMLFTEALHGAILAEAFRTPWTPIRATPALLDLKWLDWCASIRRAYAPHTLPMIWTGGGSVFSSLKRHIKQKQAIRELARLRKHNDARLSPENVLNEARERLEEQIERLRKRTANVEMCAVVER
ncbi:MAG: polysaccharide pyruvyl transferase family protein [Aromatoleum sp.]|jgi:succinoglycan biosynthesis protein ExoV|uniref:polysaccharide pyruvyl transferase family protein n=1 Tax=Aromatoleum sp. TaxID=2307007 RepID=UPI002894D423|nr:polysaccharide pyruvyl transferase family protein [Aromatoleum sp.]MDT3670686.1 polysaccharide pyruvyl transferase family protein [Aromatoleum sp.]